MQQPRLRRSIHFVPGGQDKFLDKCLELGADTLVLDLEDSLFDKAAGRAKVQAWLEKHANTRDRVKTEVLVRINPLDSGMWETDIEAGMKADGFMVPKVNSRADLEVIDKKISQLEASAGATGSRKVLLPIATETPTGVLNLGEIAKGPRVCAVCWGCEDLSAELGSGGNRHPETGEYLDIFRHVRMCTLLAAKAAGVQAIDGVYANVKDMAGCAKEAKEGSFSGWDGKLSLHPGQIPVLHQAFSPTAAEVKEAKEIIDLFDKEEAKGTNKGALLFKGKMIDKPHYTRSKKIVAAGERAGSGAAAAGAEEKKKPEFKRVHHGKYLDEMQVGEVIYGALTRTVTEADNVLFTTMSMNPAPIHLDHDFAKQGEFGKPLFNSMFTLALAVGMSVLETTHGTTIANLGFSEVTFPKPVFPGDTLRVETLIVDKRESKSRPTQGIVTMKHTLYNQSGDAVCTATRQALMNKKPAAKL